MSLSPQERKALFGMAAIGVFIAASIWEIGKRNFWFEAKNTYYTHVSDADGLRVGSVVTVAGLRVGDVASLEVDDQNRIAVTLSVRRAVASRIRADSVASVFRAFIIGEKRIDLIPGSEGQPQLANGATLVGKDTTDLAEFVTGKKLAELMAQVETLIGGVNGMVKDMGDVVGKYRSGSFSNTLTMVEPALANFMHLSDDLIVMTKEMKKQSKALPVLVENGADVLQGLNHDFFASDHLARDSVEKLNRVITPVAQRQQLVASILDNLQDLASEIKANPGYTRKMMEAVDDLSVTLRALQETWLLEEQTADVKRQKQAEAAQRALHPPPPPPAGN